MADIPTLSPVPDHSAPRPVTRRALLTGVLAAGTAGAVGISVAGCTPGSDPEPTGAYCVARDTLERRRTIGGLPLVYEPTGSRPTFWIDAGFAGQLDAWVAELAGDLGGPLSRLDTYGAWTSRAGACGSWHNAGRAFDLAAVRLADGRLVSCRYDRWRDQTGAELDRTRRAYWALAAGLHRRFAYVLTYLYDAQHANHIHLDNGRSGPDLSTFRARSRVQVHAVQAMLSYLWADPVEVTSRWDGPTRAATGRVLDQLELAGDLTDRETWHGFLRACAGRD